MSLVINDMIENSKGRKKEILLELKKLNLDAWVFMRLNWRHYKEKYNDLQQTDIWKDARKLLVEYFTYDNIFTCGKCGKVMDYRYCSLHHKLYVVEECFTPEHVMFVCSGCHEKIHNK